jgi:hypothetical protein
MAVPAAPRARSAPRERPDGRPARERRGSDSEHVGVARAFPLRLAPQRARMNGPAPNGTRGGQMIAPLRLAFGSPPRLTPAARLSVHGAAAGPRARHVKLNRPAREIARTSGSA